MTSAPNLTPKSRLNLALNEVEAMAKKATRGAGYAWGLSEEAAKATRWLCAQGLDGIHSLAEVLERDPRDGACPVTAGAALSDRAAEVATAPVTLNNIAQPVMLLPFVAQVARQTGKAVLLCCDGVQAATDGGGVTLTGVFADHGPTVTVTIGGDVPAPRPPAPRPPAPRPPATRATPDKADWDRLGRLAQRTYAPATEESRLLGAGTGLSDND